MTGGRIGGGTSAWIGSGLALLLVVTAAIAAGGDEAATDVERAEEHGLLVDAPGVFETYAYCTPCHSEMIVVQQGKTRAHWDDLLEWMVAEQGMAPIEEPDRSIILDYLAEHYDEDRPNFPRRDSLN